MDCQHCTEYLSQYADGTLGARRSTTVREHLATCHRCRREYDELLRLRALLGQLPSPTARGDFWRRTHAGVLQHTETDSAPGKARAGGREPRRRASLPTRFAT